MSCKLFFVSLSFSQLSFSESWLLIQQDLNDRW
ncbi:MAG: hypothetical protein ACI8RA_002668, partial [Chlamydiales bacterium]